METQSKDGKANTVARVQKIATELGHSANAGLVFAEPVERDGVSVIPVAKIRYGFGGREGNLKDGVSGGAGGGGLRAAPLGYIEVKKSGAKFHPILDVTVIARIVLGTLFVGIWAASKINRNR